MAVQQATIGKKIGLGFALVLALLLILAVTSYFGIETIEGDADEVIGGGNSLKNSSSGRWTILTGWQK